MAKTNGHGKYEIVKQFVIAHPHMPKRTMARELCKLYPKMFTNTELVRDRVRHLCGSHGAEKRKYKTLLFKPKLSDECPDGIVETPWQPFAIEGGHVYLFVADLHVPFHVKPVIKTMLAWCKKKYGKKIDGLIIDGDFMDVYNLSWFLKDPAVVTLDIELDRGEQMIRWLCGRFKKVIWKFSNHERRLENYVIQNTGLLARAARFREVATLEELLNLSDIENLIVVKDQIMFYANLMILHGDELKGGSGSVNPARTLFLRGMSNAVQAHAHQSSGHSGQTLFGQSISTRSIGCLCDLHPRWNPLMSLRANHGFGILDTRKSWTFENYKILNESEVVPV